MANRAMAAKVTRAKKESREMFWMESSKAPYIAHVDHVPAYDEALVRRVSDAAKPAPKPRKYVTYKPAPRSVHKTAAQAAWTMDPGPGLITRSEMQSRRHK